MIKKICAALCAAAIVMIPDAAVAKEHSREHRAVYMTPFLRNNWPSGAVTSANEASTKSILENRMKKFKAQNINAVYYHARVNCGTTYKSQYEPWSSTVSTAYGVEPAYDVFGFLVDCAHRNGIEVYAWVNPFRYRQEYGHGSDPLSYENSHPDWLLEQPKEAILNPALPEVQQRIVDVCKEIVANYDVDGLVFDDYFYTNTTPENLDAAQYQAYKAAGGELDQAAWRRENVNKLVARVNKEIKELKPYVVFGIAPAGVACPEDTEEKYGLPYIKGDWQYKNIHADPLTWLNEKSLDFISPQIYWPGAQFEELVPWWQRAADKFERHFYLSTDISDIGKTYSTQTFVDEVEIMRATSHLDQGGSAFFQYDKWVNNYETYEGARRTFGDNMAFAVFQNKVLTPLRPWNNEIKPVMTANVRVDGKTLRWDAVEGMRYTVYAVPESMADEKFDCRREYLDGISYTNSYDIPSDKTSGYRWAVAVYDRYGNEYSPLFAGAAAGTSQPAVLTYPADGQTALDLFDFTWTGDAGRYVVEVARDNAFSDIIGWIETREPRASSTSIPGIVDGGTYYWRVASYRANARQAMSDARSFVAGRVMMTSPDANATGLSLTPTFTWTKAVDGSSYRLEIGRDSQFKDVVYSAETPSDKLTLPALTLMSGRTYYARVVASHEGVESASDAVAFSTLDRSDYAAPVFVNPASQNLTLHCDDIVEVAPWDGMSHVTVYLSASETFPARSSATMTIDGFGVKGKALGEMKLSSKPLVDGKTYYLRARGSYYLTTSSAVQYTPYCEPVAFVYSSAAGVGDIVADGGRTYVDADATLHLAGHAASVEVFAASGALVKAVSNPGATVSLAALPAGVYVIRVTGENTSALKWVK